MFTEFGWEIREKKYVEDIRKHGKIIGNNNNIIIYLTANWLSSGGSGYNACT
jgi:hypothetical protein